MIYSLKTLAPRLLLALAFCAFSLGEPVAPVRAWSGLGWKQAVAAYDLLARDNVEDYSGRLLVKLRSGKGAQLAARAFFAQQGLEPLRYLSQIDVWLVTSARLPANFVVAELGTNREVLWAEVDGWLHASEVIPNDNFYPAQQSAYLELMGLPSAWVYARGGADWPIAVVDTGIDLDHPDLAAKLWVNQDEVPDNDLDDDGNGYIDDVFGWNFIMGNADPQDDSSHGSHIAGIAGAHTDNSIGVAGVAWDTPVMALKALNSLGDGQSADVAAAILYAADNGARVINLSLGDDQEYQTITDAVAYARGQGCLLAAAAGNNGPGVEYPAALGEVLAVASTGNSDLPSSFSNHGPEVDIAAPGEEIFSTNKNNSYTTLSGTSMSTAHISGAAALVWSLHPEWSAVTVTHMLTSTAVDVWSPGKDELTGWGRIDAGQAVWESLDKFYLPLVINQMFDDDLLSGE